MRISMKLSTRSGKSLLAILFALCICSASLAEAVPERAKGISMHMLPKRVADLSGKKWGLTVNYASHLKPETAQPVLQTPEEFLSYVHKQESSVQENGVWIVTTHPDAYSGPEKALLEDIKALCRREHIPLFVARGSELPNGWKRYDH